MLIEDAEFSLKDVGRLEGVLRTHVNNKAFIKKYGARAANGGSKVHFILALPKVFPALSKDQGFSESIFRTVIASIPLRTARCISSVLSRSSSTSVR